MALQLALPARTTLPADAALAPRRLPMPAPPMIPEYRAILQAPIFAPNRAPGEGGGGAGGLQGLQLIGIAAAGRSASIIVRGQDGSTHVLRPGDSLQGWRLIAVAPDRAVFSGPVGRVSLALGGPALSAPASTSTSASAAHPATASGTP